MIRKIIHYSIFLSIKSVEVTIDDIQVAKYLLETLMLYRESCVGMAANMI